MSQPLNETTTPPAATTPPPPQADEFPANTPIDQMTPPQQAAYWKAQNRKQEDRVKAWNELGMTPDQIRKLKADQDATAAAALTEQERAVAAARTEGSEATRLEVAQESVVAMLTMSLMGTDRDEQTAAGMADLLDARKFITEGRPDVAKIRAYADSVAAPGKGAPGPRFVPDMGAGNRGGTATTSGREEGLAEAQRRGYKTD